eukprot:scaffold4242_cov175-Amphora_coffeaeformis.AAC.9
MLSHILQRARLDTSSPLPYLALLQLLVDETNWTTKLNVDSFTRYLSLTFLAVPRVRSTAEWAAALPYLLVLRGAAYGAACPPTQARPVAHLLLQCLVGLTATTEKSHHHHHTNRQTTKKATTKEPEEESEKENDTVDDNLNIARRLCQQEHIGASVYSLLLDVLLYTNTTAATTTTNSTLPPPGLSAAGAEVLRTGPSDVAQNWAGEMALRGNLTKTKLALLEIVAPARRFQLLLSSAAAKVEENQDTNNIQTAKNSQQQRGTARTLTLLVLASGDAHGDVADQAKLFLKMFLGATARDEDRTKVAAWSQAVAMEVLPLALGQAQASRAVTDLPTIVSLEDVDVATSQSSSAQERLAVQRRPLESLAAAAALSFVAKQWQDVSTALHVDDGAELQALASWTHGLARYYLLNPSHHLTLQKTRIAAAQVMEALTIRSAVCSIVMSADGSGSSIETAKLLFTCASKEDERLQPRAVAALDALLSSYSRVYGSTVDDSGATMQSNNVVAASTAAEGSNPWAAASSASEQTTPSDAIQSPDSASLARSLLPLLWTASQPHQAKASRVAAARWSHGILKHLDLVKACHLLCFLAGDGDVTAASLARQGLGLTPSHVFNTLEPTDAAALPDFADFVHLVFSTTASSGKAAALSFGLQCLLSDLYGGDNESVALYLQNLVDTLAFFHSNSARGMSKSAQGSDLMDLLDVSSECFATILGSSMHSRNMLVQGKVGFGVSEMEHLVFSATSSRARRHLAEAIGNVYRDSAVWGECSTVSKWLEETKICESLETCCAEMLQIEKNHFVLGPLHGSLYLGAQLVRAIRLQVVSLDPAFDDAKLWEKICTILSMLAKGIIRSDEVVGNASADGLAVALSYPHKDAPALHPKLSSSLNTILSNIADALKTHKDGEATDAPRITKLVEAAGLCLAATTSHDSSEGNRLGSSRIACLESLMSLLGSGVNRKDEEIALRVGEALGQYAGCYKIDVELHSWGEGYDEGFASQLAPHEHALYFLLRKQYRLSNPLHRTACAPALLGIVAIVARGVNNDPQYGDRPLARAVLKTLGEIQGVFLGLLSDPKSKHLSRESCCLGIAACHGIVRALPLSLVPEETTQSLSVRLMHAFGHTTNYAGSVMQETSAQAAQRRAAERNERGNSETSPDIVEPFGMSEAGGTANMGEAALGAYREMAAASVALERPDILYDLLLLSVSHECWFTVSSRERYGATALISDSASKFWRARVGACGALSDVIVGREWIELGGGGPVLEDDVLYDGGDVGIGAGVRLLRIWRAVLRALDDVRDAVRQNGATLGRAVRALTLRLCDPSAQDKSSGEKRARPDSLTLERDASAAAATALRWLVKHGLNQVVPESQGLCIVTLVDIIGVARPVILEPSLPELIRSLLLAMSGLEPAALNYLQLRTSNQEGLERARLQLAQSGPLATAVNKCVELLPQAKHETQQAVVSSLDSALRLSAGFASRAAVADTAALMCNICPSAFVFPGLAGTASPSVRLMRAFYFATEKERGQGAKDKMVHALGNIAAFCPGGSVRSLALRACQRYRASTGTQNDPASRRAAAGALRAIAVRATKQLSDGGNSNIWSLTVLPIAFLGQKDEETKVASLMKEVWQEGGSTVQENVSQDFGTRVEEALLPELVSECLRALDDVSWSRRLAGSQSLSELCQLGVLSPLRVSGTRDSSGSLQSKVVLRAKRRAQNSSAAIAASVRLLKKPRLWTGKSKVVSETARLVSAWLPSTNENDAAILLGLEGDEKASPCQVLSFTSADDILQGDRSFDNDKIQEEISIEEGQNTTESTPAAEDEDGDGDQVDFDAMDIEIAADAPSTIPDEPDGEFTTLSFPGFCRFLIDEGLPDSISATSSLSDEFLPYQAAALRGVRDLLNNLPDSEESTRILIFDHVENKLVAALTDEKMAKTPVLVAASMECIGACIWKSFPRERAENLAALIQDAGGTSQSAWTIREAAALALSQLVAASDESFLRKPSTVSGLISAAAWAYQDRKFFKVRVAGLRLIQAMVARAGTSTQKSDLVLEALLPYKENFQKLLRKALSDSEPKVTSLSSDVIVQMSWWP